MVASIAWTYPARFCSPEIMVVLKYCQNVTYLKPNLQSDSST
jgi:hypothetical protein